MAESRTYLLFITVLLNVRSEDVHGFVRWSPACRGIFIFTMTSTITNTVTDLTTFCSRISYPTLSVG